MNLIHLIDLGLREYLTPQDIAARLNCPVVIREAKAGDNFAPSRGWLAVKQTYADGAVGTCTTTQGRAGTCRVRPEQAALVTREERSRGRTWVYVSLFVRGTVVEDVALFRDVDIAGFLADLDATARRMGAPV